MPANTIRLPLPHLIHQAPDDFMHVSTRSGSKSCATGFEPLPLCVLFKQKINRCGSRSSSSSSGPYSVLAIGMMMEQVLTKATVSKELPFSGAAAIKPQIVRLFPFSLLPIYCLSVLICLRKSSSPKKGLLVLVLSRSKPLAICLFASTASTKSQSQEKLTLIML